MLKCETREYWRCVCLISGVKYYGTDKQWHDCNNDCVYDTSDATDIMYLYEAEREADIVEFKTQMLREIEALRGQKPYLIETKVSKRYSNDYRNCSARFIFESCDCDD